MRLTFIIDPRYSVLVELSFIHKLLRVDLNDAYRQLSQVQYELFSNYKAINASLLLGICCAFFRCQEFNFPQKIETKRI